MNIAAISPPSARAKSPRGLSNLLLVVAGLVFAMVVIGGITRLTESGLSITEWKPITGAVPPFSHADWVRAFDLYRQTPQYREVAGPAGMTLSGFKFIFFWEWVHRLAAGVTDQEDAVVEAAGMLVGDIGVRAFDPAGEVSADEQVEYPIDAVGGDAAALRPRDLLGNVIGAGRLVEARQRVEHGRPHIGPLLAFSGQLVASRRLERIAFVKLMIVTAHDVGPEIDLGLKRYKRQPTPPP